MTTAAAFSAIRDARRLCGRLQPEQVMCGSDRGHALRWLTALETATRRRVECPCAGRRLLGRAIWHL